MMKVLPTALDGVFILEPDIFQDDRGYFMETYHQGRYTGAGIDVVFVQDNLSFSIRGTLRGLHYQLQFPQAKLVQVIKGEVFDVAADIRSGSPTFGKWCSVHLSESNKRQFFVSEGFAHGFLVLSESAHVNYKCSGFYRPDDEAGILWNDPSLGIAWPKADPLLSPKDCRLPCLKDIPPERLPLYPK